MPKVEIPDLQPPTASGRAGMKRRGESVRSRTENSLEGIGVAWGDGDQLHGLAVLATILDEMIGREVTARREAPADSWAEIGAALGITKQAAQQRYRRQG